LIEVIELIKGIDMARSAVKKVIVGKRR